MSDEIEPQVLQLYKPTKKIGSGAYGHVWRVVDRRTQTVKALKKNFDAFSNSTDAQRTYRQIMFLKQLRHPNIIILQNIVRARNDKDIYLVFEHMDIDLHTLIRQNNNQQHLQEKHKQYIIYQIAKSIYFLHNANIIHRDLKPSNILINESCDAKLCDFGLVRSLEEPQDQEMAIMTDYIATRWYRAPELLMGSRVYSKEVDVWALGCLVGEMFRGKAMFPGNSTINQIQKVLAWTGTPSIAEIKSLSTNVNKGIMDLLGARRRSNKSQFFPNKISPACMDLISKMLQFDPSKRIKIEEILKHQYLSEFYCEKEMKQIRESKTKIHLHINDNTKLTLKQYRDLIYSEISPKGNILETRQMGRVKNDENLIKKKEMSKEKAQSRIKTCSIEEVQNGIIGVGSNYQSNEAKTTINKDCKTSLSKKTIPPTKSRTPSMRKKGISLCSKEILSQSNSINKKKYSEPGQSIEKDPTKYCQAQINSKKLKTISRSCTEKYDKGKKSVLQTKNSKRVVCTGYFINEHIGRKEFQDHQKAATGYVF